MGLEMLTGARAELATRCGRRARRRHAQTVAPAVVHVATRPRGNPAHLPHARLAMRRACTYIWVRYRLPLAMAETLTRVADAIATLRAAGHTVTRTTKCDAARRYGCQTLLYVIDGRALNVGRLRQLALEAKTADAVDVIAARTAPHPLTARAIARKAADAYRAACLAAYRIDPRLSAADAHNAAHYVAEMEARRAFRRAHAAVQLAAANGADADGMHAAAVDAVAELAAFDAAFASR